MSYRKVAENKYKVEVDKIIKGERYRKSETVKTKKRRSELKAYINSVELRLYEQIKREAKDPDLIKEMYYEDYVKLFLEHHDVEQKTIEYLEDQLLAPRTLNFFGTFKVTQIKESHVKTFIKKLESTISERTKKPLSKKTIKHYQICLQTMFNSLVEAEIIETNPVENINVKVPKNTLNTGFYGPTEIREIGEKLIEYEDLNLELYFHLVIITGMRPSEVRALKWSKIDFNTEEILINEALVKTRKKGYVWKSTKTEDVRVQSISSYVLGLLEKQYKKQRKELNKLDLNDQYVLTSPNNDFIKENTTKDDWRRFCETYGFRYIPPYGLRHSSATLLAYNRIPLPNISAHMGHKNEDTTQKYIHATKEGQDKVNEVFENITRPKLRIVK